MQRISNYNAAIVASPSRMFFNRQKKEQEPESEKQKE